MFMKLLQRGSVVESKNNRKELLEIAGHVKWFHAIDFGDVQSRGRGNERMPQNRSLFGVMEFLNHMDISGARCLDIGAADGLVAFGMAIKGASEVIATDMPEYGREGLRIAHELLIETYPSIRNVSIMGRTSFDNIMNKFPEHSSDVVVCAGVIYHMLHPLDAVIKCRKLVKKGGYLILQTVHHPDDDGATLDLNSASGRFNQLNTYWIPSQRAVTGMLALGGFQVLATRTGSTNRFLTVLAQNTDVEDLKDVPGLVHGQHRSAGAISAISRPLPGPPTHVRYSGPLDHDVIDDLTFSPDFPPHPRDEKTVIGLPYESARVKTG